MGRLTTEERRILIERLYRKTGIRRNFFQKMDSKRLLEYTKKVNENIDILAKEIFDFLNSHPKLGVTYSLNQLRAMPLKSLKTWKERLNIENSHQMQVSFFDDSSSVQVLETIKSSEDNHSDYTNKLNYSLDAETSNTDDKDHIILSRTEIEELYGEDLDCIELFDMGIVPEEAGMLPTLTRSAQTHPTYKSEEECLIYSIFRNFITVQDYLLSINDLEKLDLEELTTFNIVINKCLNPKRLKLNEDIIPSIYSQGLNDYEIEYMIRVITASDINIRGHIIGIEDCLNFDAEELKFISSLAYKYALLPPDLLNPDFTVEKFKKA